MKGFVVHNTGLLDALSTEIAACRLCRAAPSMPQPLPHEPRPVAILSSRARILIAGQAPGIRVHESGIPFNDPSGDRLRQWLGVDRDTFYNADRFAIVPMGFCFPGYDAKGADLPPRRECAPLYRARVLDAMPQIELVLAIGQYAQAWHLGPARGRSLTETVADWRTEKRDRRGIPVLALPHPSWRNSGWIRKNMWFEAEFLPHLRERIKNLLS